MPIPSREEGPSRGGCSEQWAGKEAKGAVEGLQELEKPGDVSVLEPRGANRKCQVQT